MEEAVMADNFTSIKSADVGRDEKKDGFS